MDRAKRQRALGVRGAQRAWQSLFPDDAHSFSAAACRGL